MRNLWGGLGDLENENNTAFSTLPPPFKIELKLSNGNSYIIDVLYSLAEKMIAKTFRI